MLPLEAGLQLAAHAPVGIAQVLSDDGIGGQQFHRALDVDDGLLEIAQLVIGPAQAVDDVAVIGLQLDRPLDHIGGLGEVDPLLDHRIAEVVEHARLIGGEFECAAEALLGDVPLLQPLMGYAVIVVDAPVAGHVFGDERNRIVIGLGGAGIVLVAAIKVAEGDDGVVVVRLTRDELLQLVERLVLAIKALQADGDFHVGVGAQGGALRHLSIGLDRLVEAAHVLIGVAQQREQHRLVGVQAQSQAGIEQGDVDALLVRHRGGEREQRLGSASPGGGDEGLRLLVLHAGVQRGEDQRVLVIGEEGAVDLLRLGGAPVARQEIAIGLGNAQRHARLLIGLAVGGLGPDGIAEVIGDQCRVEGLESAEALVAVQPVQRLHRGVEFTFTRK